MPADRDCAPLLPLPERPRVLALEWNLPFHIDMADRLARQYGWNFVYWVGDGPEFGKAVEQRLAGVIFHDTVDARYGRSPAALADLAPHPFDETVAQALAYEETLILKMLDRIELEESFSYHERARLYHRLVAWWSALLDHLKPDVMIIPTAPHVHYDYVVYALCRLRGIRTAMFENGCVPGLLIEAPVFERGFPRLVQVYETLKHSDDGMGPVALSEFARRYLDQTRGSYVTPFAIAHFQEVYKKPDLPRTSLLRQLLRKAGKVVHVTRYPDYARYLNELLRSAKQRESGAAGARRISGHYYGRLLTVGEASGEEDGRHAEWVNRKLSSLRSEYERCALGVDLGAKYIYVPLHVQPERSTSPNGGIYDHAELMVEAVARSVPKGWLVYVKEHPSQFAPWQAGERGRRVSDYAAMMQVGNVRLAPLDTKPYDLIDNARAVATITGTSGWEAIARGVPVLCFGIAWYQGCDGVFDARSLAGLQAGLRAIELGVRLDPRKIELFLKALEMVGVRAFVDDEARRVSEVAEPDNIAALADALARMVN